MLLSAGSSSPALLAAGSPTRQALVIGMEKCPGLPPLSNAERDVAALGDTLESRSAFQVQRLQAESRADLTGNLTKWVREIRGQARVGIVYLRGRLLVGSDMRAYLATAETNLAQPELGGVAVTDVIRQLRECAGAEAVLFLLDVSRDAPFSTLQKPLAAAVDEAGKDSPANSPPVVVLAGGAGSQGTGESRESRSPFAVMCSRGLRGEADLNQDGAVTVVELRKYLTDTNRGNTPVQYAATATANAELAIVNVRPTGLDELLSDLADRLSDDLTEQQAELVAVPDFRVDLGTAGQDQVLGQDYGPLMRYCVTKLKQQLLVRADNRYRVIDGKVLRQSLQAKEISPQNIEEKARLQQLAEELQKKIPGKPVALIVGGIRHLGGSELTITCTPWNAKQGAAGREVTGRGILKPSEKILDGESLRITPVALVPNPPVAQTPLDMANLNEPGIPEQLLQAGEVFEQNAQKPHPLADDQFPLRVWLEVDGRFPKPEWSADRRQLCYYLRQGQRYKIWIENGTAEPVFLRLLVDGLNTLPDFPLTKTVGLFEVASQDVTTGQLPAQYANLTNARAWYCVPGKYCIEGFYTTIENKGPETRQKAERAAFVVTDASLSEAWQHNYLKDVGIITAAFYKPLARNELMAPRQADVGTSLGPRSQTTVNMYRGKQVAGELIAVEHLRYGFSPAAGQELAAAHVSNAPVTSEDTSTVTSTGWRNNGKRVGKRR